MKKRVKLHVAAGLSLAILAGCQEEAGGLSETQNQSEILYSRDIQPIFDTNCVQCHALEIPQADLVLEEEASYAMLVGNRSTQSSLLRVKPGVPEESYLMLKLKGTHTDAGGTGFGMPLTEGNYTSLPEKTLAIIEGWIGAGATKN